MYSDEVTHGRIIGFLPGILSHIAHKKLTLDSPSLEVFCQLEVNEKGIVIQGYCDVLPWA